MRETDSQDAESSAIDDDLDDEEEDVFFRNVSEDLDDEERTSYAILLILAVGGFAVGALLLQITLTAAVVLKEYSGDWGVGSRTSADAAVRIGVALAVRFQLVAAFGRHGVGIRTGAVHHDRDRVCDVGDMRA